MTDILITGATGFVGSHLVEVLGARGTPARALVRETSDVSLLEQHGLATVSGDLGDQDSLRRAVGDAEVVIHLAAATRALSEEEFRATNAGGTRRLLDAMEAEGGRRRLVYLSSLAAAGPADERPVGTEDEPRPVTAYGRSKLEGEEEALGRSGTDVVVLRPPAVYGPRDRDLLPFFQVADRGILPVIGRRDRRLQLIHARDLAEAIASAADPQAPTGVYHVAEPRAYGWDEVLELMAAAVGRRGMRVPVPAAAVRGAAAASELVARVTGRPVIFDRDKARELLAGWMCETEAAERAFGFRAAVPLARGLEETAQWYRAYGWL